MNEICFVLLWLAYGIPIAIILIAYTYKAIVKLPAVARNWYADMTALVQAIFRR
jgi:hypothetical protein